MDADPAVDPAAKGTYNATGCNAGIDPTPWTGFWPGLPIIPLHWEQSTQQRINQYLKGGCHGNSRFIN
jgi:hypothetical protein